MTNLISTSMLLIGMLMLSSVNASEVAVEFSADAVQSVPGRPSMNVKMFISKKAVRIESNINGNTMVEIVYPKDKRRVLLNQLRKTYVEQKSQSNNVGKTKKTDSSPCDGKIEVSCKKVGKEKINGRDAIKWEMTAKRNGREFKSLHWLDKKYHMPLREQFPDGTISTMSMSGKEKLNGRNTEKWKFSATRPNGQNIESMQWYDPKLKMVIREAMPGGYVRELKNIKVAKQNKKLFEIPSGYKKDGMPEMLNHRVAR